MLMGCMAVGLPLVFLWAFQSGDLTHRDLLRDWAATAAAGARGPASACARMTATMQTEIPALLAPLERAGDKEAIRFGERALSYRELRDVAAQLAQRLAGCERVAVWATPSLETCVSVVGALTAGIPVVPINPKSGERELGHIVDDSEPSLVLAAPGAELPAALDQLERLDVELSGSDQPLPGEADPESTALVVYTSGTTGPPKGVRVPRRAIASNLDALAQRLAVDRRRRADPRPAAVSRARPRARRARARCGAAAPCITSDRSRSRPSRESSAEAARRCCSACRRCTTASPTLPSRTRESPMLSSTRACWSPDRRRCRRRTTSGSNRLPRNGWWSAMA